MEGTSATTSLRVALWRACVREWVGLGVWGIAEEACSEDGIELADGSTDEADLLVAADGSNSKVRIMLLPEERLEYTGAVCFLGTSRFPDGKPELLAHKWGMNISGKGVPFLTLYVLFKLGSVLERHG